MNILLQNKKTKDYVEEGGGWTARAEQARVFGTGLEAIFYCLNQQCADMQIFRRVRRFANEFHCGGYGSSRGLV